jgi:peptidyl-prolyl cis-trans isomerase C
MQINHRLFLAGCLVAAALPAAAAAPLPAAAAAPLPPDAPLVVDGSLKVDAGDFEGYLLRAPEDRRGELRATYDRVATVVDSVYVARVLAAKAREAGVDKDPAVQRRLQQVQEALLADLYIQRHERNAPAVDLEQRAREMYKADQAKYVVPEHIYLQRILIGLTGRTRETARELAQKVYEEAKSGKADFLALAARYSEDPDLKRNGGDTGYYAKTSFSSEFLKVIGEMKVKGEIAPPIETDRGFWVVKFIDRRDQAPVKFEEVRRKLIDAEKEKLAKRHLDDLIGEVRATSTAVLNRENIEALVAPVNEQAAKLKADPAAKR